jgi:AraC family transcriptional regulator, transcriptional activator of pobA
MTTSIIPDFFVYGQAARNLEVGFMHVELVSARKNMHLGEVQAHKHSQMAQITFWTKGSGIYRIEDQSWSFSAPAISFVPQNTVHGFSVSSKSDAIVISLASAELKRELSAFFAAGNKSEHDWKILSELVRMILVEYKNNAAQIVPQLVNAVLGIAARQKLENIEPSNALAEQLRQLIDLQFRENWRVAQYIAALHSTYHLLDKAAKSRFGKPIKELVGERKILEAKRLLQFTIRSVENIAYELGYADPAYFNREFKKSVGTAPGLWRKMKSGE